MPTLLKPLAEWTRSHCSESGSTKVMRAPNFTDPRCGVMRYERHNGTLSAWDERDSVCNVWSQAHEQLCHCGLWEFPKQSSTRPPKFAESNFNTVTRLPLSIAIHPLPLVPSTYFPFVRANNLDHTYSLTYECLQVHGSVNLLLPHLVQRKECDCGWWYGLNCMSRSLPFD